MDVFLKLYRPAAWEKRLIERREEEKKHSVLRGKRREVRDSTAAVRTYPVLSLAAKPAGA